MNQRVHKKLRMMAKTYCLSDIVRDVLRVPNMTISAGYGVHYCSGGERFKVEPPLCVVMATSFDADSTVQIRGIARKLARIWRLIVQQAAEEGSQTTIGATSKSSVPFNEAYACRNSSKKTGSKGRLRMVMAGPNSSMALAERFLRRIGSIPKSTVWGRRKSALRLTAPERRSPDHSFAH